MFCVGVIVLGVLELGLEVLELGLGVVEEVGCFVVWKSLGCSGCLITAFEFKLGDV